jgi:trehalose synthase
VSTSAEQRRKAVRIEEVDVAPLALERFGEVLAPAQQEELTAFATRARKLLDGRVVWNVNSTARGGGVAEMLQSLLAYGRGTGVDTRWIVVGGEPDFFRVTKRIHNHLHGSAGDGGPLGEAERAIYDAVTAGAAGQLAEVVRRGDVVLLHDPQTAGLVEPMKEAGAHVIWRAHIGLDLPNALARNAWAFLLPYVIGAARYVFSRAAFAWEGLDPDRVAIIAPSIDPFSAKNQELERATVRAILHAAGLLEDGDDRASFIRHDGTPGRVVRRAEIVEECPLPEDAAVVAQVSRWDRLKDPFGVMEGFIHEVAPHCPAHLVLAGPETAAVTDDPEGADVLNGCIARWRSLAPEVRERIHLVMLPMADAEENAAMVNALQRWSTVVMQKSMAEGFGLTVAEAMWKGRPVVAARVGGIQDQIVDGVSGVLVDPADLSAFGDAVLDLLLDRPRAGRIGAAAQERVRADFLGSRHLEQYVELFDQVICQAEAMSSVDSTPIG